MRGSLALRSGVLYVGRYEQTAHVRPYDLDGRPLGDGFSFRGPHGEPCALSGLDVDEDRCVWIADGDSDRVRAFSVFGREIATFAGAQGVRDDARGALRGVVDVAVFDQEDELSVLVASGGWRRHAVQLFSSEGSWLASLRPEGDPLGRFNGITRVAVRDGLTYVCEARAERVQVFLGQEFHFAFSVPARSGARFEPIAVAPIADGRLVVATGGSASALLLVDRAGRLVRTLAEHGTDAGQVLDPGDVVVHEGPSERETRLAVIDRDAERVQVFTLEGRCFGAVDELPGIRL